MPTIGLAGVRHDYDGRSVLGPIDLTITEHRVGLVGANGSGKSTLARMVNGLIKPAAGTVRVDDLDPTDRRQGAAVRRRVGFVFTDPDTAIVMPTVAEDVAFSLRRSGFDRAEVAERVAATLARLGLAGCADQPAHLLSGGQKQLLAIAAVLIREPELIVADEPTTLLDLRNTRLITGTLMALPAQLLVVTHQLDQLAGFDRVIVLEQGRVVADGPPDVALPAYRRLLA